jgi:hypothetical protein
LAAQICWAGLGRSTFPYPAATTNVISSAKDPIFCCSATCHRRRINISIVLAGQKLGIKEVDDAIWLVSFMHCDLGYIDLEQRAVRTIGNPFGTRLSPTSWAQSVTHVSGPDE